jgi:hypothetical protein
MASLRQLAGCLGLPNTFSIVHDFFGYASAPPWKNAQSGQTHVPQSLSLLTQAKLVRQPHFNLHVVRVGTNDNGVFPQVADEEEVDAAVQLARRIYAEINVGIGRVHRNWVIPLSWGTGYDVIDDDCEAAELIDAYDLPPDGIKVFFVTAWPCGIPGWPAGIPKFWTCSVGLTDWDCDGSVVYLQGGDQAVIQRANGVGRNCVGTGRALAHEIGHVFGFGHENDDGNNLMCQGGTAMKLLGINNADDMIPATTGFYDWQAAHVRTTKTTPPDPDDLSTYNPWTYDAC